MITCQLNGTIDLLMVVRNKSGDLAYADNGVIEFDGWLNGGTFVPAVTVVDVAFGVYQVTFNSTGLTWGNTVLLAARYQVEESSHSQALEPIRIDSMVRGVVDQLGMFGAPAGNTLYNWLNAMANLAAAVPGAGLMGNYDPATDSLEAIRNKVDALAATGVVTVVSPVSANGTQITLVQGDDYKHVDGRALAWSGITGLPNDISAVGNTVALKLKRRCAANATVTAIAGTITTPVGATKAVRFDLPAATTGAMDVGAPAYDFAVEFSLASGSKVSAVLGTVTVLDDAE